MEDNRSIEDWVLDFLCTLHDNHDIDDQHWIHTLLDHGVSNTTSEVVELGTLIQTTIMDTLLAKLLGISPAVLAKVALVEEYICTIWEHNNLDKQVLYNFILDNPVQREAILNLIQPRKEQTTPEIQLPSQQTVENTPTSLENQMVITTSNVHKINTTVPEQNYTNRDTENNHMTQRISEEEYIQEVDMTEAETATEQEITIQVTSHDIKDIADYSIRDRVSQPLNPFFVTKKGTFMAGVLLANTPRENKEEQINYLTHIFRLSKANKDLIGTTFINGNYWYTFKFKLQLDLINCVEKLNGKSEGEFKILYLKGIPSTQTDLTEEKKKMTTPPKNIIKDDTNLETTNNKGKGKQMYTDNPFKLVQGATTFD